MVTNCTWMWPNFFSRKRVLHITTANPWINWGNEYITSEGRIRTRREDTEDTEQQKQSSSPLHEKTIRATQQRTYILYITPWQRQVWNTRFSTAYTEKRLGKTSRSNQVCIQIFIIIVYYFYFATQFLRDVSQSG